MTPNFCRHCGHSVVAGAAFCGGCGRAVEVPAAAPAAAPVAAPVTAHVPAPAAYAPAAPPAPAAGSRGVGRVLLIGLLAVVVMLGVGVGTAYLLTRGDDSSSSAGDSGERRDDNDERRDDGDEADAPAPSTTDVAADPTATVTVTEGAPTDSGEDPPGDDPETVLRDAIAADEDDVLALEGSWVPQLASISDDINGSWPAALEEYERLRGAYPAALVVDAEAWPHSFIRSETFDTVLVVLLPTPASPYSAPILDWCRLNRGDRQASCYAKRIETTGSPRDNTDQNQPEPEFN